MTITNRKLETAAPSPQSQCEVCRAARALVLAADLLRNQPGSPGYDKALAAATQNWEYSRNGRHTGKPHEPVVAP